jgi:hypothetical protein
MSLQKLKTMSRYKLPWKRYEKEVLDIQCDIAAAYMSGNLRYTKQLISELECYASLGAPRSATSGALRSGDEITQLRDEAPN